MQLLLGAVMCSLLVLKLNKTNERVQPSFSISTYIVIKSKRGINLSDKDKKHYKKKYEQCKESLEKCKKSTVFEDDMDFDNWKHPEVMKEKVSFYERYG
jgi:hypothetical protein